MPAIINHFYQHYRTGEVYEVLGFGYYTESKPLELSVIYQAQYDDPELGAQPVFVRPQTMFEEMVTAADGTEVPRFTDVTDAIEA